jgi:UDP-N-acetylmuramoyl-tripeptide--D-alanyl-D-alanine ligase
MSKWHTRRWRGGAGGREEMGAVAGSGDGGRPVLLDAAGVAEAVGGRLLNGDPGVTFAGVSIDTRTLKAGELYVAIRGDRFDGHDFVGAALAAGAGGVVVSQPLDLPPAALGTRVLVSAVDTTLALQRLARWVRRKSGARVVAITGSAGKTTTKEIAAAFIGLRHRVMRSSGNLNNHIGLPLSLLDLRHGAEVAVVELGMNHAGEIRRLVQVAEPDVRVWTNVAEVHTEFFASLDAVADAKAEILEGAGADAVLVANGDDPLVQRRIGGFAGRVAAFSGEGLDTAVVSASAVEDLGLDGMRAAVRTPAGAVSWHIPLLGRGNLMNSLAALAIGLEFGVPPMEMADRVKSLRPAAHRGEVLKLPGGVTVVDDAYNSNPRALRGALAVLAAEGRYTRRVAVLGEMLELGAAGEALHAECGRAAAAAELGALITVGGAGARALAEAAVAAGMPRAAVSHVAAIAEGAELAAQVVQPGDVVLVKGSRGIRTERVVERLSAEFA